MYPHENHQHHNWRSVHWSLPWRFRQFASGQMGNDYTLKLHGVSWGVKLPPVLRPFSGCHERRVWCFVLNDLICFTKTWFSHKGLVHQKFQGRCFFKGLCHLGDARIIGTPLQLNDVLSFMSPPEFPKNEDHEFPKWP